jgi:hypothetical protein
MHMDVISTLSAYWQPIQAGGVMLLGLLITWRGLFGGPSGGYGLLRPGTEMLGRLLGWRVFLYGLTITGVGAAWLWEAKWLLFLALGFGFVEMQEATGVIRAWRWDGGPAANAERRPEQRVARLG